jgi:hypothetical protein
MGSTGSSSQSGGGIPGATITPGMPSSVGGTGKAGGPQPTSTSGQNQGGK